MFDADVALFILSDPARSQAARVILNGNSFFFFKVCFVAAMSLKKFFLREEFSLQLASSEILLQPASNKQDSWAIIIAIYDE